MRRRGQAPATAAGASARASLAAARIQQDGVAGGDVLHQRVAKPGRRAVMRRQAAVAQILVGDPGPAAIKRGRLEGRARSAAMPRASRSGSQTSSWSLNASQSCASFACAISPRKFATNPRRGPCATVTRLPHSTIRSAKARTISGPASVDPSSPTIRSQARWLCAAKLCSCSSRCGRAVIDPHQDTHPVRRPAVWHRHLLPDIRRGRAFPAGIFSNNRWHFSSPCN